MIRMIPQAYVASPRFQSTPTKPDAALMLLKEVLIHLHTSAEHHQNRPDLNSLEGRMGQIHASKGLIERMQLFTSNKSDKSRETQLLRQIQQGVLQSAATRSNGYGAFPALGKVAQAAERCLKDKLGNDWL